MAKATKTPSPSPAAELVDDAPSFTVAARVWDPDASVTDALAAVSELSADAKRLSQALGRHIAVAKGHAELHGTLHRAHNLIAEMHHGLSNLNLK